MAFQSEAAPPVVGEAHKDTYDGDTKSEDETEEEDLEEGEILDSGNELQEDTNESSPKTAPKSSVDANTRPNKKNAENARPCDNFPKKDLGMNRDRNEKDLDYSNKKYTRKIKYIDHDQASDVDEEDKEEKESSWYKHMSRNKTNASEGPIDYRKELEMYAGTPPTSPERDDNGEIIKKKKRISAGRSKAKKIAKRTKRRILEKKAGKKPKIYSTRRPCKFYLEGSCSKGEDCPFVHMRPREQRKRELCRYYLNGYCHKGKQCTFMHDEFPCKFFHTGAKCFSGENCRFSHNPLTEETKKLLQECLKGYDNEGPQRNKRNRSKSPEATPPPNAKRICLLGSPPRHIREAEETKRWQEEMAFLQREKSTDAFQINLSPNRQPPPNLENFSRPNFYVDTMQSPVKQEHWKNQQDEGGGEFSQQNDQFNNPQLRDNDMKPNINWNNICALVESMKEPPPVNNEPVDFTDEPDFEEDDSNSFIINKELPEQLSTFNKTPNVKTELSNNENSVSQEAENSTPPRVPSPSACSSPSSNQEDDPNPIHIPSHLPWKQRELLLRIQRHQKVKSANEDDADETAKTESTETCLFEQFSSKDEEYEDKEMWSSSDDEDADKPLTDVLKKLQQMPPPKPKEIQPQKPPLDISQMLSNIMQKTTENNKSTNVREQSSFWQNILTGAVLPEKSVSTSAKTSPVPCNTANPTQMAPKRRVLLPDPKPVDKVVVPESRDPRLKNRDPRTATLKPPVHFPVHNITMTNTTNLPLPILPLEPVSVSPLTSHHQELNPMLASQTSAVVVDGRAANVPYKLYTVACMPLNYTRYVQASHSDPKLVNDPRLRKYLSKETTTSVLPVSLAPPETVSKVSVLPDLPLFGNFKVEKRENYVPQPLQEIVSAPQIPELPELRLPIKGLVAFDPRTKRAEQRLSGNGNPPHLGENPVTIPSPIATPPPQLASHLPRAIADPRMAKLHKPIDPRRSRTVVESTQRPSFNKPQVPPPETKGDTIGNDSPQECEDTDSKKKLSDSKNKAIYRNRKSSMDYASPLNSCDANSAGSLNYNKRPKSQPRNNTVEVPAPKESLPSAGSLVSSLVPDFSTSEAVNMEYDSMDANASLKDMFKTIDPTASPFC